MKSFDFSNMRGGWFVGDFYPCSHQWNGGEIAVKHFPKGHIEYSYKHDNAIKVYAVIKGKLLFNKKIVNSGELVLIDKGEDIPIVAQENSVVMLSVIGDKKFTRYNIQSLEDELSVFDSVFPHSFYNGNICFKDISVVIQGAVEERITPICIESIRHFFPGAKVILSTWKGSSVENLKCDEVVFSEDPGGRQYRIKAYNKTFTNNVNRQLVSIQNGLKMVKTQYALKIRTDMIMTSNELLNHFGEYTYNSGEYSMFKEKILVADFYTRHSLRCEGGFVPTPFHVSDWFFFGLTEDVRQYFDGTRLMTNDEQVYFKAVKCPEKREKYDYCWYWSFPPEQFYGVQAAQRNFKDIRMADWSDWDDELIRKSEKFIMNNFVVLDFTRHGINLPKYEMNITSNCGNRRYYEKGLYSFDIYYKILESMKSGKGIPSIWDERMDDDSDFWMFRKEEKND